MAYAQKTRCPSQPLKSYNRMQMQPASSPAMPKTPLAVLRLGGEKPHQGFLSGNPALYQGPTVCNSTTALGLRGQAELNRVGSRCTGKERDSESGNDYFGARYYASTMGRFMSPDPKMASGHAMNPQSWNRYSYSLNNPLKFFDPDGKEAILFYRAPDSGKSSLQDFGHVFIYVRNEKTGRSGVFDFYPDAGKSATHRSVDAARRDAHAGLSIPTTPEQADKMLDKMDSLTKANLPFNADTASKTDILTGNVNDCVTTTESILGAGGIKDSSITPTGVWNDLSTDQNDDPSKLTGNPWDATDGTRTGDLGTEP
jgi:RHS repeat-associated protein